MSPQKKGFWNVKKQGENQHRSIENDFLKSEVSNVLTLLKLKTLTAAEFWWMLHRMRTINHSFQVFFLFKTIFVIENPFWEFEII